MNGSTFGLSTEQLARLLSIGRDAAPDGESGDEVIADMLHATLSGQLSLDVSALDSLPAILCRPCDELSSHRGRSAAELLADPHVGVDAFRTLKDYAKELVKRGRSEVTRTVATVLYYAAIAAALVFHNERITQHDLRGLDHSFALLLDKPWLAPDLRTLFTRAREACGEGREGERLTRDG